MMCNTDTVHLYGDVLLNEMDKAITMYVKMYTYKLRPCPCNNAYIKHAGCFANAVGLTVLVSVL